MRLFSNFYQLSQPYINSLLDFIYPPFCVVCKSRLNSVEKLVCESCWQNLPRIAGTIIEDGGLKLLAVWEFNNDFQTIVHEMKFFRKKSLAKRMAGEMSKRVVADGEYSAADFIIPVPLHKTRLRERGFNQSLLLAEIISNKTKIPLNQNLKRIRHTTPQSKLAADERKRNLANAFAVTHPKVLRDKSVILVDDVATTGSTLNACAEALTDAGIRQILALTTAKTL